MSLIDESPPAQFTLITASRIVTQSGPDDKAMVLFGDQVLATGTAAEMRSLAPKAPHLTTPAPPSSRGSMTRTNI